MSMVGKSATSRGRSGPARPGRVGRAIAGARRLAGGLRGPGGARRRRRHGITRAELRGFSKVVRLLKRVGMHPRGLGRSRRAHA